MFFDTIKMKKLKEKKLAVYWIEYLLRLKYFTSPLSPQLMIMITMLMMVVGMVVKIILEPEAEIILILIGL